MTGTTESKRRGLLLVILVAGFAATTVVGCTIRREFIGNRLTVEDLAPLPSLGTKGDVLASIGPPSEIRLRHDGSAFHYRFDVQRGSSLNLTALQASFDNSTSDRRADRLVIEFDKAGSIVRYGFAASGFSEDE